MNFIEKLVKKNRKLVSEEKENFEPLQLNKDTFTELTTAQRDSLPNACIFKGIPLGLYTKWRKHLKRELGRKRII